MDELTVLREAWMPPDPPSPAAHTAARAALMQRIAAAGEPAPKPVRRHRPGVRLGWLMGGTAATAALAAAVAFAVVPGSTQPARSPGHISGRSTQLSGRQVLLAAATVAESRQAGTGAYWHLKLTAPKDAGAGTQAVETWTGHDGKVYVWLADRDGAWQATTGGGFQVGMSHLTFGQLQQLPTDPAALKAWIIETFSRPTGQTGPTAAGNVATPTDTDVAFDLSYLLYQVPAPPAVRAAAFRALAAMPDVTNLGDADGGQALRISFPPPPADKFQDAKVPAGLGDVRLVIDPQTATLLSTSSYRGTTNIITAAWTNEIPKVISPQHQ